MRVIYENHYGERRTAPLYAIFFDEHGKEWVVTYSWRQGAAIILPRDVIEEFVP